MEVASFDRSEAAERSGADRATNKRYSGQRDFIVIERQIVLAPKNLFKNLKNVKSIHHHWKFNWNWFCSC